MVSMVTFEYKSLKIKLFLRDYKVCCYFLNFGYCKIDLPKSGEVRGHEFHYSRWSEETKRANLWEVIRHSTGVSRREGYRTSNLHASYVHLYFPQAATFIREILHLSLLEPDKC